MANCFLTNPIKIPLGQDVLNVTDKLAKLLGVSPKQIEGVQLKKQSVDARDKSNVHFVCSYLVQCNKTSLKNAVPYVQPQDILLSAPKQSFAGKCVVVGGGPSGLFVARYLTLCGMQVTVVEKGSDVDKRAETVQRFFDGGSFDENCNVQFGLGGAGTFSDGKLTTGISSPLVHTVFSEFVRCGAPKNILTEALPHIGTDNLVKVVANLRDEIVAHGGKFLFDATVCDIIVQNGAVVGVKLEQNGKTSRLFADCVALCCGHSSRKMFERLLDLGVEMQFKPFAVGLRVEHTREFINKTQYGELFATHRDLSAASYKLVHNSEDGKHSCYSFCMCPGGVVVPANSENDTVVVNGMSNFLRNANNSNSALVVTVSKQDVADLGFGDDVLSGVRFQQHLEQLAYKFGGGNYKAPCQNVVDFLGGVKSGNFDVAPSYSRGVTAVDFHEILPKYICEILETSLRVFDRKMKGFAQCGVLTGVETRTSSPVKILRDETFQSNILGLYPVGEGAGHAGGIVSSAVDGLKVAQAILQNLEK